MKYLLDSHILLWILEDNERLSSRLREMLSAEYVKNYVSMATIWEIAIKASLGKLQLDGGISNVVKYVEGSGIDIISIEPSHVEIIEKLEFHHKDPFDRIIIATAIKEKMVVVSADQYFDLYEVQLEKV